MKKFYSISITFLIFGSSILTSCSSDDSTTPAPPVEPVGISTGDYWPTAVNNTWTYDSSTAPMTFKMVSTDVVDGETYYTFSAQQTGPATATQRLRKSNGDYFLKTEDIIIPMSGPIPASTTSGNQFIILKDYLAVGETWNDQYVQTTTYGQFPAIALNVSSVSSIEETDATITVLGTTYSDVIKTKRVSTYSGTQIPNSVTTVNYWFSKNVGIVKIQASGDTQNYTQELASHQLF